LIDSRYLAVPDPRVVNVTVRMPSSGICTLSRVVRASRSVGQVRIFKARAVLSRGDRGVPSARKTSVGVAIARSSGISSVLPSLSLSLFLSPLSVVLREEGKETRRRRCLIRVCNVYAGLFRKPRTSFGGSRCTGEKDMWKTRSGRGRAREREREGEVTREHTRRERVCHAVCVAHGGLLFHARARERVAGLSFLNCRSMHRRRLVTADTYRIHRSRRVSRARASFPFPPSPFHAIQMDK